MTTPSPIPILFLFLMSISSSAITAHAKVPASDTFRYVNEGEFGPYVTEYGASYRTTPLFTSPFQLMWFNTTPGQFYVGLRMGLTRSESLFRWVWDANRGRPVGENAALTFGTDGNLVLSEANGRVVWSTGTANKGVVGIKILPVGNIVLYDNKGRFVWQSFDHPTDTLLAGQSLRPGGPTKLVSRKSESQNSDGIYSFVLEPRGLALYITDPTASPKPLPYHDPSVSGRFSFSAPTKVTFTATPEGNNAWDLLLETNSGSFNLGRPKYNATLSFLRLQVDGNLVTYTYYEPVDNGAWERTFAFFSDRGVYTGCDLPSKCGSLGICEKEMCTACPTPKGLLGWSKSCTAPKPGPCKPAGNANYYKVVGVESFLTRFLGGEGPTTFQSCKKKCSMDCKCLGFFYWEESSKCWLAPLLGTLSSVSTSSHVAYIKSP